MDRKTLLYVGVATATAMLVFPQSGLFRPSVSGGDIVWQHNADPYVCKGETTLQAIVVGNHALASSGCVGTWYIVFPPSLGGDIVQQQAILAGLSGNYVGVFLDDFYTFWPIIQKQVMEMYKSDGTVCPVVYPYGSQSTPPPASNGNPTSYGRAGSGGTMLDLLASHATPSGDTQFQPGSTIDGPCVLLVFRPETILSYDSELLQGNSTLNIINSSPEAWEGLAGYVVSHVQAQRVMIMIVNATSKFWTYPIPNGYTVGLERFANENNHTIVWFQ